MAFVAAPNIIQVEWRQTLNGQKCENRMMIDWLSVPEHSNLLDVAVSGWNWWETTYSPLISAGVLLNSVVATYMGDINGDQATYAPDATTVGGVAGAGMPNETSFCLSLRSGFRGRSARGRWFMLGIPRSSMADDNNVSTGFADDSVSALQTFVNDVTAGGIKPVIVSFISEGIPRPGGPVYFVIETVLAVDTVVDSQRRRKPGVGQ
jgi:hypothetical protein